MMESRYLELTAKGLTLGTTVPLKTLPPHGPLRAGERLDFELEVELPVGFASPLSMEVTMARGLEVIGGPIVAPAPVLDTVRTFVPLPLIMIGPPGPSSFEVVIKEPDFHATIGVSRSEHELLPPVIHIESTGVVDLDSSKGGQVELVLKRNGSDRVRAELEMELHGPDGERVPLKDPFQRRLSFKDELRSVQSIEPERPLRSGTYSLDVTVVHSGIKDRTTLKDLIRVEVTEEVLAIPHQETKEPGSLVRTFEAHPASVFPGETVTVTLECKLPGADSINIVPRIKLGRTDPLIIEMPPLDVSGLSRALFVPGPDAPGGDLPCELTLSDGDRTILREVRPRFLNIKRSSELEVMVRTALDMTEPGDGPLNGLLLQGERPVLKELTGDLTVWTLNTGRHLMALRGRVLGRSDDDPAERDMARGLSVLHLFRRSLKEGGTLRDIRGAISQEKWVLGHLEDRSFDQGMDSGGAKDGWTAAVLRGDMAGKVLSAVCSSEDAVGPWALRRALRSLFDGSGGSGTRPLASVDLRSFLERAVGELRGSENRPSRKGTIKALRMLTESTERYIGALMGSTNSDALIQASVDLLSSWCIEGFVRLEALSAWDHPAVNAWDELRNERQRAVKHEITGLLDIPSKMMELERTATQRFDACMRNMHHRWSVAMFKGIKDLPGSITLSGTGGTLWKRKLDIPFGPVSGSLEVRAFLLLPGRSWQLASPSSESRGDLLDLGTTRLESGTPFHLDLRLRAPQTTPPKVSGLLYLVPDRFALEEEP